MATPKQIKKSIAVLAERKTAALGHIAKHQKNIDEIDAKTAELQAELVARATKLKEKAAALEAELDGIDGIDDVDGIDGIDDVEEEGELEESGEEE